MTVERRIVFDTGEILTVIFECHGCHGRINVPVERSIEAGLLRECPYCAKAWAGDNEKLARSYLVLLEAVAKVREIQETAPFDMRLEISEPD